MRRRKTIVAASISVMALALFVARRYCQKPPCVPLPSGRAQISRIVALNYETHERMIHTPVVVATRAEPSDVFAIWQDLLAGAKRHPGDVLPDGSRIEVSRSHLATVELHMNDGAAHRICCCTSGILQAWDWEKKRYTEYRASERAVEYALMHLFRNTPGAIYEWVLQRGEDLRRQESPLDGESRGDSGGEQ